ncbi:MAG: DegT/DnrJ/EryC1/StrS family aminotransferase, partial [Candidatus Hydrogenedentales bacterium]
MAPDRQQTAIPFADLAAHYAAVETTVRPAIDRVLRRGWYILGEEVSAFEQEFARWLGAAHVVGVGSGTDAIHLALRAAGIQPGDEVIAPANTCVPTIAGICAAGAHPVLADVHPDTLTLDPASVERAITPRTRAIVPVHLYGHPCDMDGLSAVARAHDLRIIEDCAQAHGATYHGRKCGTFGDAAAFSFYPTKNLGCFGDGGAVATNDPEIAKRLRKL